MPISIIVPVYKVEHYLPCCMDSILTQTYRDYELVLVDDGSFDECGSMCDEYAFSDSRFFSVHKKNGGLSDARNIGLELAGSEYIDFIDSDDYVSLEMLELSINELCKTQSDIVCFGVNSFSENGLNDYRPVHFEESKVYDEKECLILLLSNNGAGDYAWNKVYRRNLFHDVTYPKGWIYEDVATTYKVFAKAKRVAVIDRDLYFYRYNPEGISHNKAFQEKNIHAVYACRNQLDFVRQNCPEYTDLAIAKTFNFCILFSNHAAAHKKVFASRKHIRYVCRFVAENRKAIMKSNVCSNRHKRYCRSVRWGILGWIAIVKIYRQYDLLHNHPRIQAVLKTVFSLAE